MLMLGIRKQAMEVMMIVELSKKRRRLEEDIAADVELLVIGHMEKTMLVMEQTFYLGKDQRKARKLFLGSLVIERICLGVTKLGDLARSIPVARDSLVAIKCSTFRPQLCIYRTFEELQLRLAIRIDLGV